MAKSQDRQRKNARALWYNARVMVTPHGTQEVEVYNQPKQWGRKPSVGGIVVAEGFFKVLVRYVTDNKGSALSHSRQHEKWHNITELRNASV